MTNDVGGLRGGVKTIITTKKNIRAISKTKIKKENRQGLDMWDEFRGGE